MSETRDRIARQKLEEKLAKCVQYLIVVAAETGDANAYNLLAEIEGKRTSYKVMWARAKPFFDERQKTYNQAIMRGMEIKKKK